MRIDEERAFRLAGWIVGFSILAIAFFSVRQKNLGLDHDQSLSPVKRGRKVYIQEGCINCHSQYIRPRGRDDVMWGPLHSPEEILAEVPPLIGNRRQGPDLLNVSLRRSPEWFRMHLKNPRLLHSDSVMPSYAYLFQGGQGEDLVAYLSSLGAGETYREQRIKAVQKWTPSAVEPAIDPEKAEKLFQKSCLPCHGPQGLGDGPLAHNFKSPPRNLVYEPFLTIREPSSEASGDWERVIKFGMMGTSMPGQEYLTDGEVKGLVNYVKSLRKIEPQVLSQWNKKRGEVIFIRSCAPCHGPSGQGNGPYSARLNPRPRNLRHDTFKSLHEGSSDFDENLAILIRDGLPDTAMPGSPALSDLEIQDLVLFVKSLRKKAS